MSLYSSLLRSTGVTRTSRVSCFKVRGLCRIKWRVVKARQDLLMREGFHHVAAVSVPNLRDLRANMTSVVHLRVDVTRITIAIMLRRPSINVTHLIRGNLRDREGETTINVINGDMAPTDVLGGPSCNTAPSQRMPYQTTFRLASGKRQNK